MPGFNLYWAGGNRLARMEAYNWKFTGENPPLGKFLYESYKFYDELGNLTATGLNISGKDPYSDRILLWGNNAEAFTTKRWLGFRRRQNPHSARR